MGNLGREIIADEKAREAANKGAERQKLEEERARIAVEFGRLADSLERLACTELGWLTYNQARSIAALSERVSAMRDRLWDSLP